ncbi:unnamed protein product [Gongylonema pulchrum]|uniref:Solute carrier family 25 member 33 n=1 Tax=Gongylonema pulchrum TaxID=637853 RepID=A0A183CYQ5_9BILA|nr:unnamed protein product [Gongylonema pulchrum]
MSAYSDFVAGWLAGCASLLVGHPLDTIKARLQTSNSYRGITDCLTKTVKHERVIYNAVFHFDLTKYISLGESCTKRLYWFEKLIGGLYKGMLLPFVSAGFLHSLLFTGYGVTIRLLHPEDVTADKRSDLRPHEAVIGSIVQLIPSVPIDHVKTRLQVLRDKSEQSSKKLRNYVVRQSPFQCASKIYRKGGIRGLYEVMATTPILCNNVFFFVNNTLLKFLPSYFNALQLRVIIAGGLAGSSSWLCICPLEYVKNQLQTSSSQRGGMLRTVLLTYRRSGAGEFFKGGLTLALRGFPVNAVLFVVYTKSLQFLESV